MIPRLTTDKSRLTANRNTNHIENVSLNYIAWNQIPFQKLIYNNSWWSIWNYDLHLDGHKDKQCSELNGFIYIILWFTRKIKFLAHIKLTLNEHNWLLMDLFLSRFELCMRNERGSKSYFDICVQMIYIFYYFHISQSTCAHFIFSQWKFGIRTEQREP